MVKSILTVSEIFWPEGGGAEHATYLILSMLKQEGFNITVVTGTKHPKPIPGTKYYTTPLLDNSNRIVRWLKIIILLKNRKFSELFKNHEILYIPLSAYPLIPTAKREGLKIVVHLHNYMPVSYSSLKFFFENDRLGLKDELKNAVFYEYYVQKSLLRTLLMPASFILYKIGRWLIRKADVIICVSKRQAEILSKRAPELKHKIKIVYNPLPEVIEVTKKLAYPTFLYLGEDSYAKGFSIFLKASQATLRHGATARFVILQCYKNRLLIEKISKCFANAYCPLGRIEFNEVLDIYSISYALLFPSVCEEPLPYAIIEAMLTGTIPIASNIGGIPEIVGGTFAEKMLFKPGNVKEFVDKINMLLAMSKEQLVDIGLCLKEAANRRFDPDTIKKTMVSIFTEST
ncbi:MAG: glycosyltransferase family 4 protein [Thermoproteota archaeon]